MKIGIFGGCFNPPHKMHKKIAIDLIKNKYIDQVIYVPTGDSYKKDNLISLKERYNMLKIMFKNINNVIISDISKDNKYTYTYEILDYYQKQYPEDDIYFICGTDNLKEFKTWKRNEYVIKNYKLLIINRNNETKNLLKEFKENNNIIITKIKTNGISSSLVRNNIEENKDVNSYLDKEVYKYIIKHKLYKNIEDKLYKVKIFYNQNKNIIEEKEKITRKLEDKGFIITNKNYDIALALGGDGTFLDMVKSNKFNSKILYVGINYGKLGFLQEIKINEIEKFIKEIKEKSFKIEEIGIGEVQIETNDRTIKKNFLNEIIIREANLKITKLNAEIDNNLLEKYIGDGLLICTSVGSTAHNLSYGGSIIHNDMASLEITPIAPLNTRVYHSLMNSVIISEKNTIKLIPDVRENKFIITIDGQNKIIKNITSIKIKVDTKKIKCLRLSNSNFIKKINEKLLTDQI